VSYLDDLIAHEGLCAYMYLDGRRLVTTGIGHLLKTPHAACALPWRNIHTDEPADERETIANYEVIANARPGHAAGWYEVQTKIRLPTGVAEKVAQRRLDEEFLPGLRLQFPGFDGYPDGPRRAIVDMAWSLGLLGLSAFTNLRQACDAADW